MKFGLWVEPEMVNEDSDLYRAHPDWAFQVPGRPMTRGRSQLVLDLTRAEVRQYIMDNLRATLNSAPISYVKWDMNRDLTDVWSAALPAQRQGEVYHRYVLGVYEILEMLHQEFPGAHRGIAAAAADALTAVCSTTPPDLVQRQHRRHRAPAHQYGTSFCYPCAAVGAHVSAVPNDQTGTASPCTPAAWWCAAGTFGYELDLNEITSEEMERSAPRSSTSAAAGTWCCRATTTASAIPFRQEAFNAWMRLPRQEPCSGGHGHGGGTRQPHSSLLRLKGLNPNADYKVNGEVYGGDQLMYGGLALPILQEYQALQFDLERV
ncbi:MAG: alpha-galactosidase [Oscillospiraceae bacterium]